MSLEKYTKIANNIKFEKRAFINGEFTNSKSNNFFESVNPANCNVLTEVVECDERDVDHAVSCARKAFENGEWSKSSPEYRKDVLLKLAALLREKAEEIAVLESLDSGKTITECLKEVGSEGPNSFKQSVIVFPLSRLSNTAISSAFSLKSAASFNKTSFLYSGLDFDHSPFSKAFLAQLTA
jgi:predicted Fe-S protein YdhL (DUF1289 family)